MYTSYTVRCEVHTHTQQFSPSGGGSFAQDVSLSMYAMGGTHMYAHTYTHTHTKQFSGGGGSFAQDVSLSTYAMGGMFGEEASGRSRLRSPVHNSHQSHIGGMYACMHACTCMCMWVRMHMYTHTFMHAYKTHIHTYIHTYIHRLAIDR
jgi:hypothetical protein